METVIDDSSPQLLAYVSELLLAAGAWDVYRVPVQMKKGRTGVQLTVLCRPDLVPALRDLLFRETTTIGLHWRIENKMSLAREFAEVQTEWGPVRIKVARWPSGEIANASPEYEDCRKLAAAHSIPLKQVMQEACAMFADTERGGALMDRSQIEALLNEVRENRTDVAECAGPAARICRLKTWDSPSSIIIARCAPACRR